MPHRIIRSDSDLTEYVALLRTLKRPFTAEHRQGADRSLDQNALQFKWAQEAAQQRGDTDHVEIRCDWKLRYGVPILRAENEEFREIYDAAIKPLSFEMKLKLMRTYPVTSEMTVKQMTLYLDTIQRECAEQGIRLTDPERKAA